MALEQKPGKANEARASGPQNWERKRLARKTGSVGVPPAMTNAGKMPALHRGIVLNAVRNIGSVGVPPAMTNAGKMPALPRGIVLNAARESGSAGVRSAKLGAWASRPPWQKRARCPRSP